jgi:D-aminopeptidase
MEPRRRCRIRDLGIAIGRLPPGRQNAITDVDGVRVGHTTLISGDGPLKPGVGPVRTGVTVILPHPGNLFSEKIPAAVHTINGFGKPAGFEQVRELGVLESPIALTNTLNVGLVMDALVQHAIEQNPGIGIDTGSVNVIVGEPNMSGVPSRRPRMDQWRKEPLERAQAAAVWDGKGGSALPAACFLKRRVGSPSERWCKPISAGGKTCSFEAFLPGAY